MALKYSSNSNQPGQPRWLPVSGCRLLVTGFPSLNCDILFDLEKPVTGNRQLATHKTYMLMLNIAPVLEGLNPLQQLFF